MTKFFNTERINPNIMGNIMDPQDFQNKRYSMNMWEKHLILNQIPRVLLGECVEFLIDKP